MEASTPLDFETKNIDILFEEDKQLIEGGVVPPWRRIATLSEFVRYIRSACENGYIDKEYAERMIRHENTHCMVAEKYNFDPVYQIGWSFNPQNSIVLSAASIFAQGIFSAYFDESVTIAEFVEYFAAPAYYDEDYLSDPDKDGMLNWLYDLNDKILMVSQEKLEKILDIIDKVWRYHQDQQRDDLFRIELMKYDHIVRQRLDSL